VRARAAGSSTHSARCNSGELAGTNSRPHKRRRMCSRGEPSANQKRSSPTAHATASKFPGWDLANRPCSHRQSRFRLQVPRANRPISANQRGTCGHLAQGPITVPHGPTSNLQHFVPNYAHSISTRRTAHTARQTAREQLLNSRPLDPRPDRPPTSSQRKVRKTVDTTQPPRLGPNLKPLHFHRCPPPRLLPGIQRDSSLALLRRQITDTVSFSTTSAAKPSGLESAKP
jgi:hypothetical protein